jgi:hypothetical protein
MSKPNVCCALSGEVASAALCLYCKGLLMVRHFVLYCHYLFRRFTAHSEKTISFLLLTLLSCQVLAQSPTYQQYSESACILIADQVKRFQQQPQLPSYQDALKNQRRHCQQPVAQQPKPYFDESILGVAPPATQAPAQPAMMAPPIAPINQAVLPIQVATDGLLTYLLWLLPMVVAILAFRLLFKGAWGLSRNEMLGLEAERRLAKLLAKQLPEGYSHYRNLVLTSTKGDLTEIDHLVLSPFGIFVIEVKNYQGWIFGNQHQEQWHSQHYRRKNEFQNPIRQNYKHTEAVASLLDIYSKAEPAQIYSVIAFSQRAQFKTPMPDNVLHLEDVHRHIRKISALGRKISNEALLRYTARLNLEAARAPALRKEHKIQQQGQQILREIN